MFERLLTEEYEKLLRASNRDVHDVSKNTTLPIAREIVQTLVTAENKPPWYIDLLNLNLDNEDLDEAKRRIAMFMERFVEDGARITHNLQFDAPRRSASARGSAS